MKTLPFFRFAPALVPARPVSEPGTEVMRPSKIAGTRPLWTLRGERTIQLPFSFELL